MKKILFVLFAFVAFNSQAQGPGVFKPNGSVPALKLVYDVAQTKKWEFNVDNNNMLEINGTGGTPSIRLTDFNGTGNRILAVDADGDLVRTSIDPALTSVPGGSTTQVQFNNAGAFGGSANFIWDGTNVGANGIFPVSTSSGFALRNNAGTAIATIGAGSSSSTNSTWTGNTNITGDWDIVGSLDVDDVRIIDEQILSPTFTYVYFTDDIAPTVTGAYSAGLSNKGFSGLFLDGGGAGNTLKLQATTTTDKTITFPDVTGTAALGTGTANYVGYWSGTNTLTGASAFQHDGSGNVDITGSLDVDNVNIDGNTLTGTGVLTMATTSNNDLRFSPNGTGLNSFSKAIVPSVASTLSLGTASFRWNQLFITNEIAMFNTSGVGVAVASHASNTDYTIPDAGSNSFFLVGASGSTNRIPYYSSSTRITNSTNFTYNGSSLTIGNTTNQLVLGTTNTTTISSTAPSASRVYTIPDNGSDANFALQTYSTFTPEVADALSGGNTATGTFTAEYLKTGRNVVVNILLLDINTTGMTGANDLFIRNLPFVNGSTNSGGSVDATSLTFAGYLTPRVASSASYLRLAESASGATSDFVIVSEVSSGVTDLRITLSYITN